MASESIEAEIARYTAESDNWQQCAATLEQAAQRLATERDNWQQRAEVLEQAMQRMALEIHSLPDERDSAIKERDAARAERDAARAEAEGLRADLLAHPPEHAARIAELQAAIETLREDGKNCEAEYVAQRDKIAELEADLAQVRYERDVALAASKERHAASAALWESQQEMQHKAGLDARIIEELREALERTEKRYIEAKARQVPRALVGLLGVIRREAAAAEKMIL